MKKKYFLIVLFLILGSLLISGCSPSELIFGPSGSIYVDTYPTGAKILLDGSDTGYVTPCTITNLVRGTYEVTVILDGIIYIETVIVYPNKITSVYKDFYPPYLEKINVLPWWTSIILSLGNNVTIISVTAYYSDYSSANIPLSDCTYSSNDTCAIVNSDGTITGISAGIAVITVSYTEGGITKTDTVWVDIRNDPTDTPIIPPGPTPVEPEPEPSGGVIITLDNWEQEYYVFLGEWSMVYAYYTIENDSDGTVYDYKIYFTVDCIDDSVYYDSWYEEYTILPGKEHYDYALIETFGKQADSLKINELAINVYH